MLKHMHLLKVRTQNKNKSYIVKHASAISFIAILMSSIQCGLGIYFLNLPFKSYAIDIFNILISTVSVFIFFTMIHCLSFSSRKLRFFFHGTFIFIYILLWIFQFQTRSLLSSGLLEENFFEIFASEAIRTILGIAGYHRLLMSFLLFLIFLPIELWFLKREIYGNLIHKERVYGFLFIAYIGILYSHPLIDPAAYFIQDSIHTMQLEFKVDEIAIQEHYPYMKRSTRVVPDIKNQPHIFLVQIESFNHNFVETKSPDDIPFTPFYNSLIPEGLFVEKFYGPSIQTVRGQFMIHCGIPESLTVKAFIAFYDRRFHCLPEILKEAGYRTLYFHNYIDGNYDNGGPFMEKNGFEITKAMDLEFLRAGDEPYIWGWGLQDDKFYLKFFNYLDQMEIANPGKNRYFTSLLTVSSHMMFNDVPARQRYVYSDPQNTLENYSNAIRITDEYLRVFMSQLEARPYLKNSIVILTGDHSFPVGEHGNFNNAVGAYEESFRTPFLMIWKGHILPRRETQFAFSQLDIAPTLLKVLGMEVPNHFHGFSMLDPQKEQHMIPLIQPYGGVYTGSVLYPFKYMKHLSSGDEFFYNLDLDPKETQNLISQSQNSPPLSTFRASLDKLYFNQALLKKNQVWPGETEIANSPTDEHKR